MKKYENRIIIIMRETRLAKVLEAQNTLTQARFYIKQLGADFDEYEGEHQQYHASIQQVRGKVEELGKVQLLDRKYLPNFIFAPEDIILVIGQDGLVANTLKYLEGQPVIGVNPDASRWDGVLLPFTPAEASKIVEETIAGKRKTEEVTMARARIQNGQELLAVNDFFIGQRTHGSARYIIKHGGYREPQSSSGVIVSTGLGSTGWMKSIIAGASRIHDSIIGKPYGGSQENDALIEFEEEKPAEFFDALMEFDEGSPNIPAEPLQERQRKFESLAPVAKFAAIPMMKLSKPRINKKKSYGPSELSQVVGKWSSQELLFAVREPFSSKVTGTNVVFGKISPQEPLRIESLMGEQGVIFSDGMENDFISFNSGTEVLITLADKKGRIVV